MQRFWFRFMTLRLSKLRATASPPLYRMKKRDVTTTSAAVSPQMRHNWLRPSFDLTMSCTIMLSVTSPQSQLSSTRSALDPIP